MDFSWLPKVDRLLLDSGQEITPALTRAARDTVEDYRRRLSRGECAFKDKSDLYQAALADMLSLYQDLSQAHLRPVINATGVALHTNLGRSVLAAEAAAAVAEAARSYTNLEMDLASGKRSSRYEHVIPLLRRLSGAEDALVVNNNAGAVLLVLDTMAKGGEAVVSRGQLVEIGGSFRVPDIMERSGAILREVGTTNKTHLNDYAAAINEQTKLLLRIHPSNFAIIGFTENVDRVDLVELGHSHNVPVMEDLGSGCLYPLTEMGIGHEPTVAQAISSGMDVLTFSGDKLLGGPQAGIIVGKKEYIQLIKKNPLNRALRVDKFTLAALEATLRLYEQGRERESIPTLGMITATDGELKEKAQRLLELVLSPPDSQELYQARVISGVSQVGGGSLPGVELPTWCLIVSPERISASQLLAALRQGRPAALGYIREDQAYFDIRTLLPGDMETLAELIYRCCGGES